jgi:hypothetical protein
MPYGRRSQYRYAFCFAGFAALGFVGELLIVEEHLLPGREQEIHAAVRALQHLIPEFHRGCSLALPARTRPSREKIVHLSRRKCAQDFRFIPLRDIAPLDSARHALGWTWITSTSRKLHPAMTHLQTKKCASKREVGRPRGEERPNIDC